MFLVIPAVMALISCRSVIHPPSGVAEPQTVILITHGKSSSLMLPDGRGGSTRWAYGDWRYYALSDTGVSASIAAVLWPTPSALGRQMIDESTTSPERAVQRLGIGVGEVLVISVDRTAVDALNDHLTELFVESGETPTYNPIARLEFVHHPDPYSLPNSSNRVVARWLEDLGCEVDGLRLFSRWRVETASPEFRR